MANLIFSGLILLAMVILKRKVNTTNSDTQVLTRTSERAAVALTAAVLTLAIYSAISSEAVSEDSEAVKEETDQNAVLIFVRLLILLLKRRHSAVTEK